MHRCGFLTKRISCEIVELSRPDDYYRASGNLRIYSHTAGRNVSKNKNHYLILHTASNLIEGVLLRFTGGDERKMKVKHPAVQHNPYYFVTIFMH